MIRKNPESGVLKRMLCWFHRYKHTRSFQVNLSNPREARTVCTKCGCVRTVDFRAHPYFMTFR